MSKTELNFAKRHVALTVILARDTRRNGDELAVCRIS